MKPRFIPMYARVVVVAVVLGGCVEHSRQPPPVSPGAQRQLDEARRLDQLVEKLYGEGKYPEATVQAEHSLAMREQAVGPMHSDLAISLNNLGLLYKVQGKYDRAEPLYLRALAIREQLLPPTDPDLATSLNNLAALYHSRGAHRKAEPLYVRALAIREQAPEPMHREVAGTLSSLGLLYVDEGALGKAEPLYLRALAIFEKTLRADDPDLATGLNNLAGLYKAQGAYAQAEPLYVRALNIVEHALAPGHPDVAMALNNLAALYQDQGAYAKAEPLYVRACGILERTFGPSHPNTASGLANLALLYHQEGAYAKAEPLLLRARDMFERALGPEHPAVATIVGNLATLYQRQGAYGKAEPLFVRARDIFQHRLAPGHPSLATSLNNLAGLYRAQGAYEKAEPLYRQAHAMLQTALGPDHRLVATAETNLAGFYTDRREYEEAESLLVHALHSDERMLGPDHPNVAQALNTLAMLYLTQRKYDRAEPLFRRALGIDESTLGPAHAEVAGVLNNLGMLYLAQGRYGEAEAVLVRGLDIWEKALGPTYPELAQVLNNLALYHEATGAPERAVPLLLRAADLRERQLRSDLAPLSAVRKRDLMTLLARETNTAVSLHADALPDSEPALQLALTTVLRRKGRSLDSLVDNETRLRAHLTPALRDELDELNRSRSELVARLYDRRGLRRTPARTELATLRVHIEELEAALSAASAEFGAQSDPVTVAKIQTALPRNAALIEFVRYEPDAPSRSPHPREARYVAYLVTSQGPSRSVALGAAAPIDAAVERVLSAMNSKTSAELANGALRQLDVLVLAPVRARLDRVSHLLVAPDGKLNLVPFEALVDDAGHRVLETYLVSYVTTGRDLITPAHRPRSPAAVIAAPDYGAPPAPPGTGAPLFEPLAGAATEAAEIRRYFSTELLGSQATKSALSALSGPALLHIATHGFYARGSGSSRSPALTVTRVATAVPSAPGAPPDGSRSRGMSVDVGGSPSSASRPADDVAENLADALDRGGLALAGANRGADGIVTAREIAGFDWWGTQLVVLSACNTGVGAVPSGDGVYGLRRALVLAGAASQVVSLWGVNDGATRALMVDFYRELARGTGRAEALRRAKLRLMRQPGHAHPYYWAAFIPAGDWRPLDRAVLSSQKVRP